MASERNIMDLANQIDSDVSFQFVPILNQAIISGTVSNRHLTLSERNLAYQQHYQAILDYDAALFQGKKKGRRFLLNLQTAVVSEGLTYSPNLATRIAKKSGLDLAMFDEDRRSELVKRTFAADQKLAAEMKITQPSTAVIFNCQASDYGVLLENVTFASLCDVCQRQGIQVPQPTTTAVSERPNLRVL